MSSYAANDRDAIQEGLKRIAEEKARMLGAAPAEASNNATTTKLGVVLFSPGEHKLDEASGLTQLDALRQMVGILHSHPRCGVRLEAHSHPAEPTADPVALAVARREFVRTKLRENGYAGIIENGHVNGPSAIVSAFGYADYLRRRVDVILIEPK